MHFRTYHAGAGGPWGGAAGPTPIWQEGKLTGRKACHLSVTEATGEGFEWDLEESSGKGSICTMDRETGSSGPRLICLKGFCLLIFVYAFHLISSSFFG